MSWHANHFSSNHEIHHISFVKKILNPKSSTWSEQILNLKLAVAIITIELLKLARLVRIYLP